jgi:hypothetical protein
MDLPQAHPDSAWVTQQARNLALDLDARTPIRAPNANAYAERVIETMRAGPTPSTTTAAGPIAPSASLHRSQRPQSRSPSVRAMFAAGTCSADSSTSITASPHDRIRVSDPHGVTRSTAVVK